jgi:cell division septum initiation protein DivIVA
MQQALDALEQITPDWRTSIDKHEQLNNSIEALRTALAQPENDFNPDWDAMAVMVEEQQRMAKRIEELEARLAQPEQEPVGINKVIIDSIRDSSEIVAPPKREWVGLTDNEYELMAEKRVTNYFFNTLDYAHDIEAKLKEKNSG